jgi:hypothetical protein
MELGEVSFRFVRDRPRLVNEHVGLPISSEKKNTFVYFFCLVELFTCQGGYTYSPEFNNEEDRKSSFFLLTGATPAPELLQILDDCVCHASNNATVGVSPRAVWHGTSTLFFARSN